MKTTYAAFGQYQTVRINGLTLSLSGNTGENGMPSLDWKEYGDLRDGKPDERISQFSLIAMRQVNVEWRDGTVTHIYIKNGYEATIPDEIVEVRPATAVFRNEGWRYQAKGYSPWTYL